MKICGQCLGEIDGDEMVNTEPTGEVVYLHTDCVADWLKADGYFDIERRRGRYFLRHLSEFEVAICEDEDDWRETYNYYAFREVREEEIKYLDKLYCQ